METKLNYALVGLFVIVLGGALLSAVLWLTVGGTEKKQYDRYLVYFTESVAGLNPKAPVKYRGVEVGRVATIEIDPGNPERVEIVLEIERGTPIRQDTLAKLTIQGLTGLASIELTGGSRSSPPLSAEHEDSLPVIDTEPSLVARLDNAITNVLMNANDLSAKLQRLLSDQNQTALSQTLTNVSALTGALANRSDSIERTLDNLETVTATFAKRSDSIAKGLDGAVRTLENSARLSAELNTMLARVNASFTAVEEAAKTISKAGKGLDAVIQEGRRDLQSIASDITPQANALLYELRHLTQSLEGFTRQLERDPRALVFGKRPARPGPGE